MKALRSQLIDTLAKVTPEWAAAAQPDAQDFQKLPPEIQNIYRRNLKENWQKYGYASEDLALAALEEASYTAGLRVGMGFTHLTQSEREKGEKGMAIHQFRVIP